MPSNKQNAKGATFALLATMLRGRFQESMEPCSRKKKFHFVKTFRPQRFPKFSKRENDFEGRVIW